MPKYMQILMGVALAGIFMFPLFTGPTRCEDATFKRGDIVTHRLSGDRAIIGSSFCSGKGTARKRMYEVATSAVTANPVYWGQFEIQQ